jgi:hypothetical protein
MAGVGHAVQGRVPGMEGRMSRAAVGARDVRVS